MTAATKEDISALRDELKEIKAILQKMAFENSPASLSADEKGVILARARMQGKAALKEAAKRINGQ